MENKTKKQSKRAYARELLAERLWTNPGSYMGHKPTGYCVAGQSRDSDPLERSNYRTIFAYLKELAEKHGMPNAVYDYRASHWAVGWVETIILERWAPLALLEALIEIDRALADYPVWDESDFSELELEDWNLTWKNCLERDFTRELLDRVFTYENQEICIDPDFDFDNTNLHSLYQDHANYSRSDDYEALDQVAEKITLNDLVELKIQFVLWDNENCEAGLPIKVFSSKPDPRQIDLKME